MKRMINENKIAYMISEELKKSDVVDILKKDKNAEKEIKKIVADVLTDFFKVMFQHNSLFKNLVK
jgi:hypothetical protein